MQYDKFYERNIGIFTCEEQAILKESSVFIAGAGGVGGVQAVTLARMGIGKIMIMDPGIFDEPDMNRQYGAKVSTIGRNKAEVMGDILVDIAPCATIKAFGQKLDEYELREIISNSSLVIDAIDLCDFPYKTLFAQIAREQNKYHLCAPIPDLGSILMTIDPAGMTFEEFTNCVSYPPMLEQKTLFTSEKKQTQEKQDYKKDIPYISSISTNCAAANLSAALLATEAALIITGKKKKEDIVVVPYVTHIDLFPLRVKIFKPSKFEKSI